MLPDNQEKAHGKETNRCFVCVHSVHLPPLLLLACLSFTGANDAFKLLNKHLTVCGHLYSSVPTTALAGDIMFSQEANISNLGQNFIFNFALLLET